MLSLLISAGEKMLEEFEASECPVDPEFVADVERIVRLGRNELTALNRYFAKPS